MSQAAQDPPPAVPKRPRGVLVRSEDTGGAFALVEYDIPPGRLVAPLHTHRREDEYSFVLAGSVGCQIGDATMVAGPHELLSKHRGIPHTLWNPGDSWARVLELIVPGGFERCLEALQRPDASQRLTSPSDIARLMAEYEVELDGESVSELLRQHGLKGVAVS